jgi:hypothetical protein
MTDKTFKMKRRGFLGLLAGIPLLGRLSYSTEPSLLYALKEAKRPSFVEVSPSTLIENSGDYDVYLNGLLMREGHDYKVEEGQPFCFIAQTKPSDVVKILHWKDPAT